MCSESRGVKSGYHAYCSSNRICAEVGDGTLWVCSSCGDIEALIAGVLIIDHAEEAWVLCSACIRKLPFRRIGRPTLAAFDACDRPVSVRVGDFFPFRRVGFTGLLVVFTAGSAEDQTEIKAEPEVTKEKAMAKTKPVAASPGGYRPNDRLLAFLEAL